LRPRRGRNGRVLESEDKDEVQNCVGGLVCSVCWINKPVAIMVPCGHVTYCRGCARKVLTDGETLVRCPVCGSDTTIICFFTMFVK
jgi:rRNA maturation endonuclease Nob1